jgi:hypothetical protein
MRQLLIDRERATVAAFKARDEREFTRFFSTRYVGIANDGIKSAVDEIAGMHRLQLREIMMDDEDVSFPSPDVGIITYTMKVRGRAGDDPISATIYTSTVYANEGGDWRAVLHTESMAP